MLTVITLSWFLVTAVYADDSCASAAIDETNACRLSEIEIWCPDPAGTCEARERLPLLEAAYPPCGVVMFTHEQAIRPLRDVDVP